jgi:Ca2+-binding RTX toxin-like protein
MTLIYNHSSPLGSNTLNGTGENDTLLGFAGNDTIDGGAGADYIFEGIDTSYLPSGNGLIYGQNYNFGLGNDVINGGAGFDVLDYSNRLNAMQLNLSAHSVTSGTERDIFQNIEAIRLGAGADQVTGVQAGVGLFLDAGADTLSGTAGFAYADGSYGTDLLDFSGAAQALTVNLLTGRYSLSGAAKGEITNFEIIIGARMAANLMIGGIIENNLTGGNLGDTIKGADYNDLLSGLAGNDSIVGGLANDTLNGDGGNDSLSGGNEDDVLFGGNGADLLNGNTGSDDMYGGAGADILKGSSDNDRLYGGAGNDSMNGGYYSDSLYGGDGADLLYGNFDDAARLATSGTDTIFGGAGNDHFIITGDFGGSFYGDDGDDTVTGTNLGSGIDVFFGGIGNDLVQLSGTYGSISTVSLGDGNDSISAQNFSVNQLYAASGNDSVDFLAGNAYGGLGDDTISMFSGTLFGGSGNDVLTMKVVNWTHDGFVDAGSGDDVVSFGGTKDILYPASVGAFGGAGYDVLKVYDGSFLVSTAPVYDQWGKLTTVSGFEEIQIMDTDVQVRYLRTDTRHNFGATNDVLMIENGIGSYATAEGNDEIIIRHADITLDTGDGDDDVTIVSTGYNIVTGNGNDVVSDYGFENIVHSGNISTGEGSDNLWVNGSGVIDSGNGDDRMQLGSLSTFNDGTHFSVFVAGDLSTAAVSAGNGNDKVIVQSLPASLDLGAGNDWVSFETFSNIKHDVTGGAGADHFQFRFDFTKGNIGIADFDTAHDTLAIQGVASAADLDSVTAYAGGVRIIEGNWTIFLPTVTLANFGDVIFGAIDWTI